jgi:hypothetical protein
MNNIYLIIVILIVIGLIITSILLILKYTKKEPDPDPTPQPTPQPPTPHTCDNKPQDFKCPPDNYDINSKYTAICKNDMWTCVKSCPDKPDSLKCDNASCDESTEYIWKCNTKPDTCENKPDNFTCPPKNSDNLSKYTAICDDTTNRNWICKKGCLDKDPSPDSCDVYYHRDCKESTDYKWICLEDDKPTKCSDNPPDKLNCPTSDDVNYNKICNNQTGFKWICQPSCKPNSTTICDTGQHPGCNIETDYKWKCVTDSSDVCGTTIKPSCSGAMCIDTDKGWDWKCPSELSRDDVIKIHNLQCKDITNYDDGTIINICFTDTNYKIPISPTIGNNCTSTSENHTFSIGKDLDNIINNPNGNIYDFNKFAPYDIDKRTYYIPNKDKNERCVLKDVKCNNGIPSSDSTCTCNNLWYTTKNYPTDTINNCNSQKCYASPSSIKRYDGKVFTCEKDLVTDCSLDSFYIKDAKINIKKIGYWYSSCSDTN